MLGAGGWLRGKSSVESLSGAPSEKTPALCLKRIIAKGPHQAEGSKETQIPFSVRNYW